MPRIMSRNPSIYRRRRTAVSTSPSSGVSLAGSSSTRSSSNSMHMDGRSTPQSSTSSSTMSSPTVTRRPYTLLPMETLVFPGPLSVQTDRDGADSSIGGTDQMDDHDSWGHFIDTAEAEEEIIRHSKILSKRYTQW